MKSFAKATSVISIAALVGAVLVAGTYQATRAQTAQNERNTLLRTLNQVMPADYYDNELLADKIDYPANTSHAASITVYRAWQQGQARGVALMTSALEGYNGRIQLLIGLDAQGTVLGVRVLSHQETPGLGDAIEHRRSDWITAFNGRSLENPSSTGWQVKRDGGIFDQFTGATITPRAVVRAVYHALQFYQQEKSTIFPES
ncbi:electron transport complex subunit RsxG [Thioflexithrix psekupsensis]|uniref:electron transport complex subunit RsxG n=1 Tax=Thioflexithrix psekupsensis TaxID=1570016 RepID=UPI001FD95251|nr:electron transport complex subunit RsxG [Thioflexithrix psekupsensis]